MPRTDKDRILDYLRSVGPRRVTNSGVRDATNVRPHQQVFQITQELRESGVVRASRRMREWPFWLDQSSTKQSAPPARRKPRPAVAPDTSLDPSAFEKLARLAMSIELGVPLTTGEIPGVPKQFDIVSPDN